MTLGVLNTLTRLTLYAHLKQMINCISLTFHDVHTNLQEKNELSERIEERDLFIFRTFIN